MSKGTILPSEARWLRDEATGARIRQITAHPSIHHHPFFFVPGDVDRGRNGIPFQRHAVEYAEPGSIAIWETKFSGRYSRMKEHADLEALGFEQVPKAEVAGPGPYPWERAASESGDPELNGRQHQ